MTRSAIEDRGYGITRYWIHDNRIVVVASEGNMRREAVDTWATTLEDMVATWHPDEPIFAIIDVSGKQQGFTPYARQRTQDMYKLISQRDGTSAAVVLGNTLMTQMIAVFVSSLTIISRNINLRVFRNIRDAERWIIHQYEKHYNNTPTAI